MSSQHHHEHSQLEIEHSQLEVRQMLVKDRAFERIMHDLKTKQVRP